MKIMAIDYGDARTGVAISDALGWMTGQTMVIHSWKPEKTAEEVVRMFRESGAERLVMGFPRNMDGTEGPRAALYRDFAALLEQKAGIKPILWDERRTTIEAHQILNESNYHGKKRKNTIDAVAASLILEGYLAYLRNHKEQDTCLQAIPTRRSTCSGASGSTMTGRGLQSTSRNFRMRS